MPAVVVVIVVASVVAVVVVRKKKTCENFTDAERLWVKRHVCLKRKSCYKGTSSGRQFQLLVLEFWWCRFLYLAEPFSSVKTWISF